MVLMTSQITAGELSTGVEKPERQLSVIFQIANQWDAILLLDEADMFLERHSSQNLHHNGLVSGFLHKLEYCSGILFLAANRVSEFDEATLSRTHIMLRYHDLDREVRRDIWTNFPKRAHTRQGAVTISSKHLDSLVKAELNGRHVS
jgi:hypothetical protein